MAIDKVQMQRGISLSAFRTRYGSEAQCEEALATLRWPEGFCCSACGHRQAGTEVEPFRWLNTVLGNLKTALSGTHHAFAFRKYGHRYLADAQYRFDRRYRLAELPTRLAVALLQAKPRPAWDLRIPAEAWT